MTRSLPQEPSPSARWLAISATAWTAVALTGQLLFASYITGLYGGGAARGRLAQSLDTVMPRGHVEGDTAGNTVLVTHLIMAVVLIVAGGVQLFPIVRRRMPRLHRWSGRLFAAMASLLAMGGLYLVWVRGGAAGDIGNHLGVSANALVILGCAFMTLRTARQRRLSVHRKWALRLYLTANGVWFFRIGLMLWLVIHQRPVGFDPHTFTGSFLTTLAFVQFLLPLAVLEGYLRAREHPQVVRQWTMVGILTLCTLATTIGSAGAALMMWWPRL